MSAIESLEPLDEQEPDVDLQEVLDEEPCYPRKPGPKAKYKPGTRQQQAAKEVTAAQGSWWTRPDANFPQEAQRMRDQPTRLKVPGENNIVGWSAAF